MAKRSKVQFSNEAFRELRNAPGVRADLRKRAEKVAAAAEATGAKRRDGKKKGYVVTDLILEDSRSAFSVMAIGHAHNSNRRHSSLVKAMDAGRG